MSIVTDMLRELNSGRRSKIKTKTINVHKDFIKLVINLSENFETVCWLF